MTRITTKRITTKRITRKATAAAATVVLAGCAITAVATSSASADGPEREAHGNVAGARYEISIEKERRFEIDAELEGVPAGSTWRMVVRHEGKRVAARTAHAHLDDGRYEVDFREVQRRNTAGGDRFKVRISRVDGAGTVVRTLTFRR